MTENGGMPAAGWRDYQPVCGGLPFPLCERFPVRPGLWDLRRDAEARTHWVGILRKNAAYLLELVRADGLVDQLARAERVVGIFEGLLDDLAAGGADDVSTVHAVTQIREQLLRCHGLYDPYFHTKRRQAQQYLPMAMELLEEAWAAGGAANGNRRDHLALLLTRLLAGNLFDLGSQATQEAFRDGHLDPIASAAEFREEVIDWLSGQPAEAIEPWMPCPREVGLPAQGRVLLLADNAGPDFLLGILPVALYLARRWEVWVVANTHPASSDITYQEACTLLDQLAQAPASAARQAIRAGRLRLLASGTGSPGIDLRHVGAPLCAVAEDAAWLLIDGQGRGVETNWDTRFSVPVYRMAVVKDPWVAERIGRPAGRPLLRWDPPA